MKNNYIKVFAVVISLFILISPVVFAAGIENPLKFGTNIGDLVSNIMKFVVRVGGVVAVFMFIYTGFNYVAAQGDPGKITKVHEMFKGTVIGVAVLLGAQLIASIVVNTIQSLQ